MSGPVRPVVRRAGPERWGAAREVRLRALADAPSAFASTLEREQGLGEDEWRGRLTDTVWMLAEVDGHVVGVACGTDRHCGPDERHLVGMWVEPAWRGTAVAAGLVEAVDAWRVADGAGALTLWVVDGNARARRFYTRLGFVSTGERGTLPREPPVGEERMVRRDETGSPRRPGVVTPGGACGWGRSSRAG